MIFLRLLNEDESNRTLDYPVKERLIELRELVSTEYINLVGY